MDPIKFGLVGSGWRGEFFLRIARACPERFTITGVIARRDERRQQISQQWGVEAFSSAEDMLARTEPDFVVTSVPWAVNPGLIEWLAGRQMPVLSETPPAPDIEALVALNQVGGNIQVAEQYHLQPHHAARLALARSGLLGRVSQAQVSAAHGYHGISLMRRLLGVGYEPCTITGHRFTSPLVAGPDRDGPPDNEEIGSSSQDFLHCDFGDRLGVFDFTGDQYFSWIRNERVLVRGERGEVINSQAVYLKDFRTPIKLDFVRHVAGANGNLEGHYLKGIQLGDQWLYENPFVPVSLSDDEIAIASCLVKMAHYVETGEDFYSLAEASQDHYLGLMGAQALQEGKAVETDVMPWAKK
ncbi:MAG: gfo/Idh/MocA family oxidoreductase [Candidatus Latescibacteria bacterium]|nr:gfo/Idh/MocA family oxidoreductase [Candidatus Latescibacterota bacterium]